MDARRAGAPAAQVFVGRGRAAAARAVTALALAVAGIAGCATPPRPLVSAPPSSTAPAPIPSAATSPSPPAEAAIKLIIRMEGKIGCAQFPYGCLAATSVLPPGTDIPDSWRPPATDPRWLPDFAQGIYSTDHLRAQPEGPPPVLTPGPNLVVVSLLGTYDTPSFNPDGTMATDLLARCATEVDAPAAAVSVAAVVTFTRRAEDFGGTCSIKLE